MIQPKRPRTWKEAEFYFLGQIRMIELVIKSFSRENFLLALGERKQEINRTLEKIRDKIERYKNEQCKPRSKS